MPNLNELPNGMQSSRISDFGNDSTSNPYLAKSAPSNNPTSQNPSTPPIPSLHGSTPQENNAIQYAHQQSNSVSGEGLSTPEYHNQQYNAYMKGLIASG